ncbi:MAG: sigma-70 family RNA polymerase sigma factor [Bacteroidetes bacterium]|nr:MAG: sigma-70 family RNA polymerase sigma factor [Bacteroidota bacterium]
MEKNISQNLSAKGAHDWKLIQLALKKGDQKAYAELMGRYKDIIFFMLLKMVKDKDDADDLTIEAFGKAFRNLGQYTPDFAFSTWLFKIATNNCIDFIRRKKNAVSLDRTYENSEGTEMLFEPKSDFLNPEEKAIKKQKIEMMQTVVEKLQPRYRTLVELRYFQEKSYEEIAQDLDLPIGTVKAQLFRARELLYHTLRYMEGRL